MIRSLSALLSSAIVAVVTFAAPASAVAIPNTVYVGSKASGAGGSCASPDYSTAASSMDVALADAITAVNADGDTIVICNGTYRYQGSIELIVSEFDFEIVAQENGKVTLDGARQYGLISVAHEASSLTIEGINFINASDTGAIYRPDGDLIVLGSQFINNNKVDGAGEEGGFGGGAINGDHDCGDSFEIYDSVFRSNSGPTGAVSTCELSVDGSTFINNSTRGSGGALYVCGLVLTDSTFSRNSSSRDGGAVSACEIYELADNKFDRNVARENGGAIAVSTPMDLENPWTGNTFRANRARAGGAISSCKPEESRRVQASLRRANRFQGNYPANVEFDNICRP